MHAGLTSFLEKTELSVALIFVALLPAFTAFIHSRYNPLYAVKSYILYCWSSEAGKAEPV